MTGDLALIALADCGPIDSPEAVDLGAWEVLADAAICAKAATGLPFTTYDLVSDYQLPKPPHPNHWGPFMLRHQAAGLIARYGWTNSHRPTSNSSGVRVWIGTASTEVAT
jgi:hypothetical protein